ncbi:MAG: hydrogenase maturation protease [Dehalococcoidia bacterium]|nr:hydrogenase maturation protease [Dehalococcoidia bacterium]
MKTLVLGLGNPILGDDSVGLRIVREVEKRVRDENVTVLETTASGLALLDVLIGYERLIIVDAIQTREGRVGDVYRLAVKDIDITRHSASPHDTTLTAALELGRRLGLPLPKDENIAIVAVGISPDYVFSEECSEPVEKAIPLAVEMVMKGLYY